MDWSVFQHPSIQNAILAGLCAGITCSAVGVFVVTMHLSFLGVCIAHAAFAGALFSILIGTNEMVGALIFSLAAAAVIGPLADRGELSPDASIGIIFSFMLGLAFLFLSLLPGSRTEALSLFWGSILSVRRHDLIYLIGVALVILLLIIVFFKEIQAVLCHRQVALSVGIPTGVVFYGMLFATGVTVAVSLPFIGGLLIYSLLLNPAAAAFQLTYSLKRMFVLAALFGVSSCWIGLIASYLWDVGAGAAIVLASASIFAFATALSPKRKMKKWKPTGITR